MTPRKPKAGPPKPRKRQPPTDRQREYLAVVARLAAETGSVSAMALADALGVDRKVAMRGLRAVAAKGLLADVPKVVSSGKWALTAAGRALLEGED